MSLLCVHIGLPFKKEIYINNVMIVINLLNHPIFPLNIIVYHIVHLARKTYNSRVIYVLLAYTYYVGGQVCYGTGEKGFTLVFKDEDSGYE